MAGVTTHMAIEPQKVFIGLMDFFSILLPSTLLTWLLTGQVGPAALGDRNRKLGGAQAWAAFLFARYLFGHLIFLARLLAGRFLRLGAALHAEHADHAVRPPRPPAALTRPDSYRAGTPWRAAHFPWKGKSIGVQRASQ